MFPRLWIIGLDLRQLMQRLVAAVALDRLEVAQRATTHELPVTAVEIAESGDGLLRVGHTEGHHTGPAREVEAEFDILEHPLTWFPPSAKRAAGITHQSELFTADATISEVAASHRLAGDFLARLMEVTPDDRYVSHFYSEREVKDGRVGGREFYKYVTTLYNQAAAGKLEPRLVEELPHDLPTVTEFLITLLNSGVRLTRITGDPYQDIMPDLTTDRDITGNVRPPSILTDEPFTDTDYGYRLGFIGRQGVSTLLVLDPTVPLVVQHHLSVSEDEPISSATSQLEQLMDAYAAGERDLLSGNITPLITADVQPYITLIEDSLKALTLGRESVRRLLVMPPDDIAAPFLRARIRSAGRPVQKYDPDDMPPGMGRLLETFNQIQ